MSSAAARAEAAVAGRMAEAGLAIATSNVTGTAGKLELSVRLALRLGLESSRLADVDRARILKRWPELTPDAPAPKKKRAKRKKKAAKKRASRKKRAKKKAAKKRAAKKTTGAKP